MKRLIQVLLLSYTLLPACKKKAKDNTPASVNITAETLAGKYIWVDYAYYMKSSGTYTTLFTSCESCNQYDTLNLVLNGASQVIEEGSSCGSCSYSMVLSAASWSVKNNAIVTIGQAWKIDKFNDSMLELLSTPDSAFHTYKLVLKRVKPDTTPLKTYTVDQIAGNYLWDQYTVDASRNDTYVDQFTSCESCNKNDTLALIKGGAAAISEEGSSCGPCTRAMVITASSWSISLNVLTIGSVHWVINSFDNGTLQLFSDPGAPNPRQKITLKKLP
jgi:hypothetical protein